MTTPGRTDDRHSVVDGIDVDAIVAGVRGCDGVTGLVDGPPQRVATFLPQRRVAGVRIDPAEVVVQVSVLWGRDVAALGALIRTALRPLAGGRRVDVVIATIGDPPRDHAVEPRRSSVPGQAQPASGADPTPNGADPDEDDEETRWETQTPGSVQREGASSVPIIPTAAATPAASSPG